MAHVKEPKAVAENEARKLRTRTRLMEAAVDVISAKGFAGCQIRDIVQGARVSIGTFYFYFRDKEEIFLQILGENNDLLRHHMEEQFLAAGDRITTLRGSLEVIYGAFFEFIEKNQKWFLCFFRSGANAEKRFGELVDRVMAEAVEDSRRRLQLGIDAGVTRGDLDMDVLAHATVGMIVEVGHQFVLRRVRKDEAIRTLVEFSLNGLTPVR